MNDRVESVGELKSKLETRSIPDRALLVERYYRYLPRFLARMVERNSVPRHMRAMHPLTSLRQVSGTEWDVCYGRKRLASTRPLDELVAVKGRRVLLVATGPSAANFDWSSARKTYDFIVTLNGGTTFLKEKQVRPDLHIIVDRPFLEKASGHLGAAPGVPLITNYSGLSAMAALMPDLFDDRYFGMIEKVNSWYGVSQFEYEQLRAMNYGDGRMFHFPEESDPAFRIGWSARPEYGYFTGSTVVFTALQLLVRYGASRIDIVGMDLSSAGHVYKDDMQTAGKLAAQYDNVVLPSFRLMAQVLKGHGVRIHNLSPVCPLPTEFFAS